jgi:hypothetical protein
VLAGHTRDDLDAIDWLVQATDGTTIATAAQKAVAAEFVDERLGYAQLLGDVGPTPIAFGKRAVAAAVESYVRRTKPTVLLVNGRCCQVR